MHQNSLHSPRTRSYVLDQAGRVEVEVKGNEVSEYCDRTVH